MARCLYGASVGFWQRCGGLRNFFFDQEEGGRQANAQEQAYGKAACVSKIVQKVIGIPFEADGGSSSAKAHCEVNQTDQNCAVRDIEGGARLFSRQRKDIFEQDIAVQSVIGAGKAMPIQAGVGAGGKRRKEAYDRHKQKKAQTSHFSFEITAGDSKAEHIQQNVLEV